MKLGTLFFGATFAIAVQGELVTRNGATLVMRAKTKTTTTTDSSTTATLTYPHGYPLCGIPNSDLQPGPGSTTAVVHQQYGSSLQVCVEQCHADVGDTGRGPCKSILFEDRYTMCLFYDIMVEETRQVDDGRFRFGSWDKDCYVG